jgi:hypothetical protein
VKILIVLEELAPPAGTVQLVAGHEPPGHAGADAKRVPFAGWLGLLRALDEVIGAPDHPPDSPP